MNNRIVAIGAFLTALGICIGAFGAHALRDSLSLYGHEIFKTASLYHLIHGLALVVLPPVGAIGMIQQPVMNRVAGLFIVGILIFSGSLYLLAITEVRWLGAVTPIGGLAFIVGWLIFGFSALKSGLPTSRIDNRPVQG